MAREHRDRDTHSRDHDFEYTFEEDYGEMEKYFVLTGFQDPKEIRSLELKIEKLGGILLRDVTWNDHITHVISKSFASSELVLAGLAAGRWILNPDFIYDSNSKGYFVRAKPYVHDESVVTHRKNWKRFGDVRGGAFYNMKALFLMSDIETKEVYQRIVYAGGGDWRKGDTRDAIADRVDGRHLTHIFADPWILQRGSRRYDRFQDWLDYEKKVSKKSSNYFGDGGPRGWQNAGILHKLDYTFLIDKLLRPLEKINEFKYNIFDLKVLNKARRREENRKKHRIKMEELRLKQERKKEDSDEDEEDLATIKQRLVNKARMKAPGRFYIDKAREKETICEEEVRMQSSSSYRTSVKRKASEDEMVAHLGYMESSKRKNKRSAGSFIQADARKHIKSNGFVDTSKLFSDHGFDPIEERSSRYISNLQQEIAAIQASHPLNKRPKTFSDNNWWNRSFKGQTQVKNEFVKQEFVKKENFHYKSENSWNSSASIGEVVDLASDSDDEIIEILETGGSRNGSNGVANEDAFDLPPGIVLVPQLTTRDQDEDEDDIVCLSEGEDNLAEDNKPSLKELVQRLGNIPEIELFSSSSDSESEDVPEEPTLESTVENSCDVDVSNLSVIDNRTEPEPSISIELESPEVVHDIATSEHSMETTADLSKDLEEDHPLGSTERSEVTVSSELNDECEEPPLQKDVESPDEDSMRVKPSPVHTAMDLDVLPALTDSPAPTEMDPDDLPHTTDSRNVVTEDLAESTITESRKDINVDKSTSITKPSLTPSSSKDILLDILHTILKRQEDTNEHLIVNKIYVPTIHYDKMKESKTSSSKTVSLPNAICHEFDIQAEFEDNTGSVGRSRRGRRRKVVEVEEDDETDGASFDKKLNLIVLFRQLSLHVSSGTILKPEILNVIFKKFFLENKDPALFHLAEDFLDKYFVLQYGKDMMINVLSSMRHVTSKSLFQKFDLNTNDIRSVVDFMKEICDKSLQDDDQFSQGSKHLLKAIIKILKRDFLLWWRYGRRKRLPLLYYVLGGSEATFVSTASSLLPKLYTKHVLQSQIDDLHIKELVTISAMMTAFLDQKEKQDLVHQGWKKELAGAFADTVDNIEDPKEVYIELKLMEPSWFGFLVGNIFLERKRNMKISKLADLSQKFFQMSDKSALVLESSIEKYFSTYYPHVIFRSKWFFSSKNAKEAKFEVFSKMKKLVTDTSKHKRKEITLKSQIRKNVKEIGKDLATLTNFATEDHETDDATGEESVGAISSLLFRMNLDTDLGWHPSIAQQQF